MVNQKSYLLDTNILIYIINQNEDVCTFVEKLDQERFYISPITRFEFLVGAPNPDPDIIRYFLNECLSLPVDRKTSDKAAELFHRYKDLKFKDALIAASALLHEKTLVTADKGFKKIVELDLEWIQV
jgi:predicted nucleic acid-binding protein